MINPKADRPTTEWLDETLSMLVANGWRVTPVYADGHTEPYADGQSYPEPSSYTRAVCIGVCLDSAILVDWDGYKASEQCRTITDLKTIEAILGDNKELIERQQSQDGQSLHFLYSRPSNVSAIIQCKNDWLPAVDLKTGNQLMHIKPQKILTDDELPPIEELPEAPLRLLDGLARTDNVQSAETRPWDGTSGQVDEARELLKYLDPGMPRQDWIKVLAGLNDRFGESGIGLELADEWSSGADNYAGSENVRAQYLSLGRRGGVTFSSLAYMAGQAGANLAQAAQIASTGDECRNSEPNVAEMSQTDDSWKVSNSSDLEPESTKCRNVADVAASPDFDGPSSLSRFDGTHLKYPLDALPKDVLAVVSALQDEVKAPTELAVQGVISALSSCYGYMIDAEPYLGPLAPLTVWQMSSALSGDRKTTVSSKAGKGLRKAAANFRDRYEEHHSMNTILSDLTVEGMITKMVEAPGCTLSNGDGAAQLKGHAFSAEKAPLTCSVLTDVWSGQHINQARAGNKGTDSRFVPIPRLVIDLSTQEQFLAEFMGSELYQSQGLGARFLYYTTQSLQGTRHLTIEEAIKGPKGQKTLGDFHRKIEEDHMQLLERWKGGGTENRIVIPISYDAKVAMLDVYNWVETRMAQGGAYRGDPFAQRLVEHAKRLAGLFACYRNAQALTNIEISLEDAQAGLTIAKHHLAVYKSLIANARIDDQAIEADELHKFMREHDVWTSRELNRLGPARFRGDAARIKTTLAKLIQMDRVIEVRSNRTGPTSVRDISLPE